MATNDVPGSNPANGDVLAAGCWAEHEDGSMLYVKGTEDKQVVYELYDLAKDPPVYYQDAMRAEAFEKSFGRDADDEWTWHDKTPFPWGRVMKIFDRPVAKHADVHDELSAAARIADSLRLRARKMTESDVSGRAERIVRKGRGILERLERAFEAFVE